MPKSNSSIVLIAFICTLILVSPAFADPTPPASAAAAYLTGLDAMEHKDWKTAADAFGKAADADDENVEYHTAHGIALFLAGDNAAAKAEFEHSLKLDHKNPVTSIWAAAFYRGTGDPIRASQIHATSDYMNTPQEAAEKLYQTKYDHKSPQDVQAIRDRLDAFGVKYATDAKASHPETGAAIKDRMTANFTAAKWTDCLNDLGPLLQASPRDIDLLYYQGVCRLNLGDLLGAREELTRVLTFRSDASNAYAQRAIAEAKLGNFKRARADIVQAQRFNSAIAKTCADQVEAEISASKNDPAGQSAADQWTALQKAADTASDPMDLVPQAMLMQKIMNARRLRWDELYQDQLRQLEDVVRAKPNDVDALLDLGIFIYRECDIPGEQSGPGGIYHAFRYDGDNQRQADINRADDIFDHVLQIQPKNALALTWKATIRLENNRWDQGVQLVNQAMAINQAIPELLELLTRVLDDAAWCKSFDAENLRTPKSWTTEGIDTYTIWTRYPTQAEINGADELDQQAQQLWKQAQDSLATAVLAKAGTADGYFYDGLLKQRNKDMDGAIRSFEKAVKMAPTTKRYRQALMRAYRKAGRDADAIAQRDISIAQCQTTATSPLSQAWNDFVRTAYKSARDDLEKAVAIDPADDRIPAYFGSFASGDGKSTDMAKWFNIAEAYEIANAQLHGRDITPTGKTLLDPQDIAMAMLLNLHLAAQYKIANQRDLELAALQRNLSLAPRLADRDMRTVASPSAVLPSSVDPIATTPRTIGNLLAWSHVLAGYNLFAQNKADQAGPHFTEVANWRRTNDIFAPQALAVAVDARLYWANHDPAHRAQFKAASTTMTRLSREEIATITTAMNSHVAPGDSRTFVQNQGNIAGLAYFQQEINIQGGYQEKFNANYHGTNDVGPDGQVAGK